ncbi:hypothetical protein CYMTET_9816 [Cymbomonas tetramitiformis]|uniref:Histone H3-K79 methyltransferase n=1 Tax=Cymbomonas tetramitiformis TaxID=36881 RepID=A0AAE0GQW7_9CHLO|nr:hypothetical protein CYMTET_9816 [Cymbomonas tetramitiformis]
MPPRGYQALQLALGASSKPEPVSSKFSAIARASLLRTLRRNSLAGAELKDPSIEADTSEEDMLIVPDLSLEFAETYRACSSPPASGVLQSHETNWPDPKAIHVDAIPPRIESRIYALPPKPATSQNAASSTALPEKEVSSIAQLHVTSAAMDAATLSDSGLDQGFLESTLQLDFDLTELENVNHAEGLCPPTGLPAHAEGLCPPTGLPAPAPGEAQLQQLPVVALPPAHGRSVLSAPLAFPSPSIIDHRASPKVTTSTAGSPPDLHLSPVTVESRERTPLKRASPTRRTDDPPCVQANTSSSSADSVGLQARPSHPPAEERERLIRSPTLDLSPEPHGPVSASEPCTSISPDSRLSDQPHIFQGREPNITPMLKGPTSKFSASTSSNCEPDLSAYSPSLEARINQEATDQYQLTESQTSPFERQTSALSRAEHTDPPAARKPPKKRKSRASQAVGIDGRPLRKKPKQAVCIDGRPPQKKPEEAVRVDGFCKQFCKQFCMEPKPRKPSVMLHLEQKPSPELVNHPSACRKPPGEGCPDSSSEPSNPPVLKSANKDEPCTIDVFAPRTTRRQARELVEIFVSPTTPSQAPDLLNRTYLSTRVDDVPKLARAPNSCGQADKRQKAAPSRAAHTPQQCATTGAHDTTKKRRRKRKSQLVKMDGRPVRKRCRNGEPRLPSVYEWKPDEQLVTPPAVRAVCKVIDERTYVDWGKNSDWMVEGPRKRAQVHKAASISGGIRSSNANDDTDKSGDINIVDDDSLTTETVSEGYGEMTCGSVERLFEMMEQKADLGDSNASLVDIGSGYGKVVFHAVLGKRVGTATGIECVPSRHLKAQEVLDELEDIGTSLSGKVMETGGLPTKGSISFELADVTKSKEIPHTHIYMYDKIFKFPTMEGIARLLTNSPNWKYLATYHRPYEWEEAGLNEDLREVANTKMATTGHQNFTCWVYRRGINVSVDE